MKICWDNLEKLEYRPDRNQWQGNNFWIYKENCLECDEAFLFQKGYKTDYCCRLCSNKTISEETRRKLSKSKSGEKHHMYGKNHSSKTKRKMSISHKDRIFSEDHKRKLCETHPDVSGNKNPNWKGGISCEPYCDIWLDKEYKESIKERDGYQCLNPECNKTSKRLCIHHIDYNKKHCKPNNLITLCNSCNTRANKNRKWHESWYNAIMYRRYGSKT